MTDHHLYEGREQTLVKHLILRGYLERFAHIIGSHWNSITYVDCFSGPWQSQSQEYEDTSFAIAIEELCKARGHLAEALSRNVKLRCFFLEKDKTAHAELASYAGQFQDVEIRTVNAELEDSIGEIVQFVKEDRSRTFSFLFIDPKGWTGFAMDTITPLLRLRNCEVLINFMTGHIRRFIDSPEEQRKDEFDRLFGSPDFRPKLMGLSGLDRDDAAVAEYAKQAKKAGGFSYASTAVVLHPQINKSHFHLIYLTRDPKGIEVFKAAEKRAMAEMETVRAKTQQRRRVGKSRQIELFSDEEGDPSSCFINLRERYLQMARSKAWTTLKQEGQVAYDSLWSSAMSLPMVWEKDLKDWIHEWRTDGLISLEGMKPRQRVPKRGQGNYVVLTAE